MLILTIESSCTGAVMDSRVFRRNHYLALGQMTLDQIMLSYLSTKLRVIMILIYYPRRYQNLIGLIISSTRDQFLSPLKEFKL